MVVNALKSDYKNNEKVVEKIVKDIYSLPSWEISGIFSVIKTKFYFFHSQIKVNLLHKISKKENLEQYLVRSIDGEPFAFMDLKMYKDSIYIINLAFEGKKKIPDILDKLVKIAINKAQKGIIQKKLYMNIPLKYPNKRLITKVLLQNGFKKMINQSEYETSILGMSYVLDLDSAIVSF